MLRIQACLEVSEMTQVEAAREAVTMRRSSGISGLPCSTLVKTHNRCEDSAGGMSMRRRGKGRRYDLLPAIDMSAAACWVGGWVANSVLQ